ncbi:hypothetical protein PV08_06400 [Exophiala spinifera]|uniref:Uncharacterized protein n=1 Tax=Exophiala spinifera TaxID=91928 RepID=A0A0D2BYF1_9EURO|nr:uncharacterized protein PV08_06400 [Exophiala spinifera]KIW16349.1 hypothetical protein PV08_06400 [Exophiala spinifera]
MAEPVASALPPKAQSLTSNVNVNKDLSTAATSTAPTPTASSVHDGDNDVVMSTSPTTATVPANSAEHGPVPLDSPLRTTPIHPAVPAVKVPADAAWNLNPITLQPFTDEELTKYGYEKVRAEVNSARGVDAKGKAGVKAKQEEVARLREETANMLRQKLEERETKLREITREMEEKEKIREVERKVFRKRLDSTLKKD